MELLIGAHDPEGRMVNQLSILEPTIKLFSSTIAAVTPSSSVELGITLQNMGVSVIEGSRSPHETGLNLLRRVKSGATFVTMDKLLHMQQNFPQEVEGIARSNPTGFVLFGRTARAFDTFPDSWKQNESIANAGMAVLTGIPDIDICVGHFATDRETAEMLSKRPILPDWECLVEMPADAILAGRQFKYVALECLEWEDPDRYQKEIQEEGFEAWKKRLYDSPVEWTKRRNELRGYMDAINRFRERLGLPISRIPFINGNSIA